MNKVIFGICKKDLMLKMKPFLNCPTYIEEKMIGYSEGNHVSAYLHEDSILEEDVKNRKYVIPIRHEKITLTRAEIEESIDITWEKGKLNGCVKGGVPCNSLRGLSEDELISGVKSPFVGCSLGWEVGRSSCYKYAK